MHVVPFGAKLLGGNGQLKRGTQVQSVTIPLDYEVGFGIAVSQVKTSLSGWRNIVHFTATGANCCGYGSRVPGVWFEPGTLRLYVVDGHTLEGNGDTPRMACDRQVLTLQRGKSYQVKMVFQRRSFSIWVNGAAACSNIPREDRKVWKNVRVYVSDPWYKAANAVVSGLYLRNLPSSGATGVCFVF